MAAASIAVCGFEHGVRQITALGLTGHAEPVPAHVTREPTFVLAGRDGVVVADGVHTAYPSSPTRAPRWRRGSAPIIVGALPFDMSTARRR